MKPNKPYVLGLTGGIACGKTNVANTLRSMGLMVLDADALSRVMTADGGEALPEVRQCFGDGVFDGERLNRRALGEIVFSDPVARAKLEAIIHPRVVARMRQETDSCDASIVVWDVPLLYEVGMDHFCDEVWCVFVHESEQLRRLMRRDALSREQALSRMRSQLPLCEKKRRAQHLINSAGEFRATRRRVRGLLRDLRRRLGLA